PVRSPFEREAVGTPARVPARDCHMPRVLFTRGAVGPPGAGVQVRVELRLTRARVLGCLGAEVEVVQRPRLAGELACLAVFRAGVGAAVAANERLLELPLATLETAPAVRVRALDTIQRGSVGRPACRAAREADGCPDSHEGPETASDHACEGLA